MRRLSLLIITFPLLLLLLAGVALATPAPDAVRHVFGVAGDTSSGPTYVVRGTLGQPVAQVSTGSSVQVVSGFWAPIPPDQDGDGIPDEVEGDGDADGDGTPNYLDPDSDGDGIPDAVEGTGDVDGDGTPNFLDADSDGDGIPDGAEGTDDADGDGTPNFLDLDSDGDGIPDEVEGTDDVDGDGIPNYLDTDSDGDGMPDEWEYEHGTDPYTPDTEADPDDDGIQNGDEYRGGTDPLVADVLVLEKTRRDLGPVDAGDVVEFILAVTNNSSSITQTNVTVVDTLPSGLELIPGTAVADTGKITADGDTVTLTVPALSYEQIAIATYKAVVGEELQGQIITNTATAHSDQYGPIVAEAAVHVNAPPPGPSYVYLPLVVRNTRQVPGDPYEPNDTGAQARELADSAGANFYDPGDEDWFYFDVVPGATYIIQTDIPQGSRADTILELYADSGGEILLDRNDDWNGLASRIIWQVPVNAVLTRLYIRIYQYDPTVAGEDTSYTVTVIRQ